MKPLLTRSSASDPITWLVWRIDRFEDIEKYGSSKSKVQGSKRRSKVQSAKSEVDDKMRIERFEDIQAWQAARELTRSIYKATSKSPFSKDFGLKDQVQRASVSIMANIAEGFDSTSDQGFVQFLGYSLRSATEVQSHLYVALDQSYISRDEFDRLYRQTAQVKRMIMGFIRYLRNKDA